MDRASLVSLLVVAIGVGAAGPAWSQPRKKAEGKEAPRVLKAGDEVRLSAGGDEPRRHRPQSPPSVPVTAPSDQPNATKAGVVGPGFFVLAVLQVPAPGEDRYRDRLDEMTHVALLDAARVGDRTAVERLLAEGRAARLTVGTRLLVTYRIPNAWECRARVVDGPEAGKVVEVPVRAVR